MAGTQFERTDAEDARTAAAVQHGSILQIHLQQLLTDHPRRLMGTSAESQMRINLNGK